MSTFTFSLEGAAGAVRGFESRLSANTPDDKLTYSGNDPIIWDRVNSQRLNRGLSPLSTPRPADDVKTTSQGRGQVTPPGQTSKTFDVDAPPGMTREQAYAIFQKQVSSGALTGFNPGDILSAQTQAADGLAAAQAQVSQGLAGFPGTDQGSLNSFKNIAETTKQSLAAGTTGSLQSRLTNAGSLLQQTGAKLGGLVGMPVTNGINAADFATTATALVPMAGLNTTDVRATMAAVGTGTGQNYNQITNAVGVGKFGFDTTQLETAGLVKPGTAATFLGTGNSLTSVLQSPAVWTGKDGIKSLDSLLSNPTAQNFTQQNLMSSGLASAKALGLPIDNLNPKSLSGVAANFAKSSSGSVDWIKGQLPADQQAEFDQRWKDAQFAVGSADEKFNDAMLQQAPPGEAVNTVNRETLTAAVSRVFGNAKIPPIDYNGPPQPPPALFAENRKLTALSKEQQVKLADLGAQEVTTKNVDALIAQYVAISKYLNGLARDYTALQKDVAGKPYTEFIAAVDTGLATVLALIDDIRTLYLPNLRRLKG